jgi:hypothetical protein
MIVLFNLIVNEFKSILSYGTYIAFDKQESIELFYANGGA